MEEAPHKEAQSKKVADPLVMAYVAFAGFALFLLLPAFFFSLGPLISTRGRAWEYDLVRELFIASVVTFILIVLLPLVAAYKLSRRTRWSRASVMAAAVTSALVGLLFLIGGITRGWPREYHDHRTVFSTKRICVLVVEAQGGCLTKPCS